MEESSRDVNSDVGKAAAGQGYGVRPEVLFFRARISEIRFSGLTPFPETFPARVYRVDLTTGHREDWKEFMPGDPTGITSIGPNAISADGKTILFGYSHTLSDLYIAEGLR